MFSKSSHSPIRCKLSTEAPRLLFPLTTYRFQILDDVHQIPHLRLLFCPDRFALHCVVTKYVFLCSGKIQAKLPVIHNFDLAAASLAPLLWCLHPTLPSIRCASSLETLLASPQQHVSPNLVLFSLGHFNLLHASLWNLNNMDGTISSHILHFSLDHTLDVTQATKTLFLSMDDCIFSKHNRDFLYVRHETIMSVFATKNRHDPSRRAHLKETNSW